jgi:hypothetical protein
LLDLLYALEQIQVALYEAILAAFDEARFDAEGFPPGTRRYIEAILEADRAHLGILVRPDGAPAPPIVATDTTSLTRALEEAITLENLATAAYAGIIPVLGRERLIPELLGIHSVEARQATYLTMLVGRDPVPTALDSALSPEDTLARIEAMIQEDAGTPVASPVAVAAPITAIAADLGAAPEDLMVLRVEPRDWPDTSLGCPQPGEVYAEVITPGFLVEVEHAGERIEYHTDDQGNVIRCPDSR